jgi:5-methylcytosine-specific restriction endonuclease McrBC GTP-binding regulatory subunit McrB
MSTIKLFKNNKLIIESTVSREIYRSLLKDIIDNNNISDSFLFKVNKFFNVKKGGNYILARKGSFESKVLIDKIEINKNYSNSSLFDYDDFVGFLNYSANDTLGRIERFISILKDELNETYTLNKCSTSHSNNKKNIDYQFNHNTILFGAPGTGKSFDIKSFLSLNCINETEQVFRTTFYEDYSYFDFVGQFKPTMLYKASDPISYRRTPKEVNNEKEKFGEPTVIYEFIPGIFIDAYIKARKLEKEGKNVYLIIEEINRGNAAAIFGEFFQSLDRDENGISDYPVRISKELTVHIQNELKNEVDVFSLPSNLFIIGTMNTSDQSLFKMDTAFKRRWSMKYHAINFDNNIFNDLCFEGTNILWKDFISDTNKLILKTLNNEDKLVGQFFCKAQNNKITKTDFFDKLLQYLFFDVFRFNRTEIFNTESFNQLYNTDILSIYELIKNGLE